MFVETLNWQVPHDLMVEMDQYDLPEAKYVIVVLGNHVVGGTRLLPGAANALNSSTMIGEALQRQTSILPEHFPNFISFSHNAWEGTRLVLSKEHLGTQALRKECLGSILFGVQRILHRNDATALVTISAVKMEKLLWRYGLYPKQLSDAFVCEDDGRSYQIFETEFPQSCLTSKQRKTERPSTALKTDLRVVSHG